MKSVWDQKSKSKWLQSYFESVGVSQGVYFLFLLVSQCGITLRKNILHSVSEKIALFGISVNEFSKAAHSIRNSVKIVVLISFISCY